jgi:ABC-type multidrug transport system ATPase subunit
MIEIKNVSKNYGAVKAVRNVNLAIQPKILFGLIGPDGAGKTSLFRLITTLLIPDNGSVTVFGFDTVSDYRKIRTLTGYMPGRFSLYPDLTVQENLSFYATIFGTTVEENYHLVKPVYSFLEPFRNRLSRDLSGGMKQKLALSCALIHNPRLLILDEPTTGVDAVSRKEFWETLHELKESGMSILVSTPYMDEAEKCDRIALMQEGKIMREDTPADILTSYKTALYEVRASDRLKALEILRANPNIKRAYLFGHAIHIALQQGYKDAGALEEELSSKGIQSALRKIKPDFEDCFIDSVENEKASAT